jgi:GABA(A) receptor-associated protein
MSSYKNTVSFNARREATKNILNKYSDKCPIYLTYDSKLSLKPKTGTNFNKYIINNSLTLGQYLHILKKRIEMGESTALTLFISIYKNDKLINTILPPMSKTVEQAYIEHKDEDGFLYMHLVAENTFG